MTLEEKMKMLHTSKLAGIILLIIGIASTIATPFMFTAGGLIRFGVIVPLVFLWISRGCFKYKKQLEKEITIGRE